MSAVVNYVVSSRNREIKSAYSIAMSGINGGFIVDCDSGKHGTNLTAMLKEIMKVIGIDSRKKDTPSPIQLKVGSILFPPIFMNEYTGVNTSMENLPHNLKKPFNIEGDLCFCFPAEKLDIGQFQENIMVSDYSSSSNSKWFPYDQVFLDCSGNLLANETSILKKSIEDVRKHLFPNINVTLHYIMRTREVVSQEYYSKAPNDRRRDILLYCIQRELVGKLDIWQRENGKKLSPMARLIDNIVLVFNLYNEDEKLKEKLFSSMLEDDLRNIPTNLRFRIPKLQGIYLMKKCKKLLGSSKKYHERIFDYLTASMNELPHKCLEQIG